MYCRKCGNKLKEGALFCTKCGNKVSVEKVYEDEGEKKKINPYIVAITIGLIIITLCIILGLKGKNNGFKTTNVSSSTNTSAKLDVIDEDKKEFKINIDSLKNAIIEANDNIQNENRSVYKSSLKYDVSTEVDQNGNSVIVYTISYDSGVVPFALVADAKTKNVYRICVLHPYLNAYGTELNTRAIDNYYNILRRALSSLHQDDLYQAIQQLQSDVINDTSTSQERCYYNVRGVEIGAFDSVQNNYGNTQGVYFFYGVK